MATLVGNQAPEFQSKAVIKGSIVDNFSLKQYLGKSYVVLFFYPKDFTFVCPTELHAFQSSLESFTKRNVVVVGCSTDTEYSHMAWLQMPRNKGGIQGIEYPIIADTNKTISSDYGVLTGKYEISNSCQLYANKELVAYRGTFIIDQRGVIQHESVNNMPLGRNVKEILRIIDALQHFENHGEVCPMNWEQGGTSIKATHESVSAYLSQNQQS